MSLKIKTKWTDSELLEVQLGSNINKKFHKFNEFYLTPNELKSAYRKFGSELMKLHWKKLGKNEMVFKSF